MFCTTCGSELDPQGACPRCASIAPVIPATLPTGDAFVAARPKPAANKAMAVLFGILSIPLFALVLLLNYLRALRWAGVMNAESFGYMMGGVLVGVALGFLGMFIVRKARGRRLHPASKALGVAAIAFVLSCIGLAGEFASRRPVTADEIDHRIGDLLKEAAGTKPPSGNLDWWDAPVRDFFHDIFEMNKQYTAEVKALDNSAIQVLYSVDSYREKARMETVVGQLQAAQAVDEKYASLDPLLKKLEERIAKANASESEKQEFLKSMEGSMKKTLAPRDETIRTEREWLQSTIALYQFVIAHSSEYTIKANKLYFDDGDTRKEFVDRQKRAIALHKEFLKTKSAADDSRKANLSKLGVSQSDVSPSKQEQQH